MEESMPAMQHDWSQQLDEYGYLKRSRWFPLIFAPAVLICGTSWLAGGIVFLTDLGFGLLTVALLGMLVNELRVFGRRYGMGGILVSLGSLIFFCHDYFFTWSGVMGEHAGTLFNSEVMARAAFYHAVFVMCLSIGLLLPWGNWMVRLLHAVPEPTNPGFYVVMIAVLCTLGLLPYFLFTAEPWYLAIWHDIVGARGSHAAWTVGSTGALNYSWGAYAGNLIDLGEFGGILASVYAILIARSPLAKIAGWSVWLFWSAEVFGTGSRSFLLVLIIPPLVILFIKYHAIAAAAFKTISIKAYVVTGILLLLTMFVVKYQIDNRNQGYTLETISLTNPFDVRGNEMMSSSLPGFLMIPAERPFFFKRFPGESLIRPIPEWLFRFLYHPIPRPLWHGKPVDPLFDWYNHAHAQVYFGTSKQQATISHGAVGHWYFRYGMLGVIQGGLFIGWLMVISERALQRADGRIICMLIALALAAKLFNGYRGFLPAILYEVIFAGLFLFVAVKVQRACFGGVTGNAIVPQSQA